MSIDDYILGKCYNHPENIMVTFRLALRRIKFLTGLNLSNIEKKALRLIVIDTCIYPSNASQGKNKEQVFG